jgi:AP-3 complex subunit delta-1
LSSLAPRRRKERVQIVADEGIEGADEEGDVLEKEVTTYKKKGRKKGLLQVDASGLVGYSLDEEKENRKSDTETEMAKREVERFRREMKLVEERIEVQRRSAEEGKAEKKTKIKKPKKGEDGTTTEKKKKKKKAKAKDGDVEGEKKTVKGRKEVVAEASAP